jgi:hypothetical protein
MVFKSRQPYWVDRCRPARRCKTLGVLNAGGRFTCKSTRYPLGRRIRNWMNLTNCSKENTRILSYISLQIQWDAKIVTNAKTYNITIWKEVRSRNAYAHVTTFKFYARSTVNWSIHLSNICQSSCWLSL